MPNVDNLVRYVSVQYRTKFPSGKSVQQVRDGDSIQVQLPAVQVLLVQGDRCQVQGS